MLNMYVKTWLQASIQDKYTEPQYKINILMNEFMFIMRSVHTPYLWMYFYHVLGNYLFNSVYHLSVCWSGWLYFSTISNFNSTIGLRHTKSVLASIVLLAYFQHKHVKLRKILNLHGKLLCLCKCLIFKWTTWNVAAVKSLIHWITC